MIQWLYRYIFRGFGILFLIAVLTCLYVAINYQIQQPPVQEAPASVTRNR